MENKMMMNYLKKFLGIFCIFMFFQNYYITNVTAFDFTFLSTNKKAGWIEDAFESVNSGRYPRIKAISYWNENWGYDILPTLMRIDSSPESLEAYRQGIKQGQYTASPNWNISSNNEYCLALPSSGLYHGANPDTTGWEDIVTSERISEFETLADFPIMWVYFSNNWWNGNITFPAENVKIIRDAGKIPFIRLMPRSSEDCETPDPLFTMQSIIDGNFDDSLTQWAKDAQAINSPLIVEFGVEVNGEWFAWNGKWNGADIKTEFGDPTKFDGAERFVAAYQHIHNKFTTAGASNLTWIFHLDVQSAPGEPWNDYALYYPGDEYVDWIAISCYGPQYPHSEWEGMGFTERMDLGYPQIEKISPNKPMMLVEFGVNETSEVAQRLIYITIGLGVLLIMITIVVIIKKRNRKKKIN
jgi:hypothetical protein